MIGFLQLAAIAGSLDGELQGPDAGFSSVSIDTRTLQPGDLYVAIRGNNFDGNDFVGEAQRLGASAAVVSRFAELVLPQLRVGDTTLALGRLGKINRHASTAKLVGITGSQGKTTVKEMTGRILQARGSTLITEGNLNNAIGVPLTLLRLAPEHRFGVIEMGANRSGEIAYSVDLVQPDVVVITNAARAHLEGFGSLEGVARAKGEIIDGLGPDGTAVLNADDRFYPAWRERAGDRRVVSFSTIDGEADYFATAGGRSRNGRLELSIKAGQELLQLELGLLGLHNVGNAAAACALAMEVGADLEAVRTGLESIEPVKGRLCLVENRFGGVLIDDSYNASPDSFRVAVEALAEFEGHRILIVGDMAELGAITEVAHAELGSSARKAGIHELLSIGQVSRQSSMAFGAGGQHFESKGAAIDYCRKRMGPGVVFLVKGSRSAGMDEIVHAMAKNS